jgi:hypothetical protein
MWAMISGMGVRVVKIILCAVKFPEQGRLEYEMVTFQIKSCVKKFLFSVWTCVILESKRFLQLKACLRIDFYKFSCTSDVHREALKENKYLLFLQLRCKISQPGDGLFWRMFIKTDWID